MIIITTEDDDVEQVVQTYVTPFTLTEENFNKDPSEIFPFVKSAINN